MEVTQFIAQLWALIPQLSASGILAAVIAWWLNRKKAAAEVAKVEAETKAIVQTAMDTHVRAMEEHLNAANARHEQCADRVEKLEERLIASEEKARADREAGERRCDERLEQHMLEYKVQVCERSKQIKALEEKLAEEVALNAHLQAQMDGIVQMMERERANR